MKKIRFFINVIIIITLFNAFDLLSKNISINKNSIIKSKIELSLEKECHHSIFIALQWLEKQQEQDGSWSHSPAMTALALSSFIRSNPNSSPENPFIIKGFTFLKNCIHPDGGIYNDDYPVYNTSICLIAFKDANKPEFSDIIKKAEDYLMGLQCDEKKGYTKDSLKYGGIGYDPKKRPDLSNLQWTIEALIDKEKYDIEKQMSDPEKQRIQQKKIFYDKALVFLSKCQNLKSVNPETYSGDDGGFMYGAGISKAEGTASYGSMTYAGLKTMIYAQLTKHDPRVNAAYNWIKNNYSLEENPGGLGKQGLYYYYQTMAKSLNVYNEDIITDNKGSKHNWREELANQLLKIQNAEGWWQNDNNRWMENNKILVTTYSILALEQILFENK